MLENRINDLIKDSLPEKVGHELKKELDRLYQVEANFKQVSQELGDQSDINKANTKLINELNSELNLHRSIDEKSASLDNAIRDYELTKAQDTIAMLEGERDRNAGFVSMLLRNPVLKHRTTNEHRQPITNFHTGIHGESVTSYGGESVTHENVIEEKEVT